MIRSSTTGKKKRKNNRYSFASLLIGLLYFIVGIRNIRCKSLFSQFELKESSR